MEYGTQVLELLTSFLIFGNLGSACMSAVVTQRPRLRRCFRRRKRRMRLQTRLDFTLMALVSLISVRSLSTWVEFSITRLPVPVIHCDIGN